MNRVSLLFVALFGAALDATVMASRAEGCNVTALDMCLTPLEPLLNNPLVKGIPSTQESVHLSCRAFKGGMACIDRQAEKCLSAGQRAALEKHVAGARHTFAFLCDDPGFQAEFLKHQSCFRGIAKEWEYCATYFQTVVASEVSTHNVSHQELNLGLCCAKHAFLRCVYYKSQYKCPKDAALFLMRLAQTLSDFQVHEDSCRKINFEDVCTGSGGVAAFPLTSLANFPFNLTTVSLVAFLYPLLSFYLRIS